MQIVVSSSTIVLEVQKLWEVKVIIYFFFKFLNVYEMC